MRPTTRYECADPPPYIFIALTIKIYLKPKINIVTKIKV